MTHTIIVPGVGGSEHAHWQSWLQRQLMSCSRVEQDDWNHPVLNDWIARFVETVQAVQQDIQIVAHSFGSLTTVAALAQHPELHSKIKNVILVAPANPARFGEAGFAQNSVGNYQDYFLKLSLNIPMRLLISENDPWLSFQDAKQLAKAWKLKPVNLGRVGHINVASGFGPFPEIFQHLVTQEKLISEKSIPHISITDDHKYLFKFAF